MRARGIPVLCAALVCSAALMSACAPTEGPAPAVKRLPLTLGIGKEPLSALVYVADHEDLFAANGLDLTLIEYDGGSAAACQALLAGDVDVALCTDTLVVIGALGGTPVTVVATVARDPNDISVLARKSAGITAPSDLRGKRIGVQPGTAAAFFVHSYLTLNGMSHEDVSISSGTHAEIAGSLVAGDLDAAAVREPFSTDVARALGDDLVVLEEPGLYTKTANLCTDPDTSVETGTLTRLIRALVQAEGLMSGERSGELRQAVAERIGSDPRTLSPVVYEPGSVSLRQALLLNLEDQARWAIAHDVVADPRPFDALTLLDASALDAVDPERVSVIR